MKPQTAQPKISVIIPTHNSAKTLKQCLESVKNQTCNNYEIVIVDDLSVDETLKVAEQFGAKIFRQKSNPAKARNIGVANSTGEYVLFLDSDQVLSKTVIEECVNKCMVEKVEMILIPEVFVGRGFWSSCSAVWRNNYDEVENLYAGRVGLIHGKPRFFVKTRILDAGLFDDLLLWGEDYDLYERLKKLNVKEGSCSSVLYHFEGVSLKQFLLKNLRYGESMPVFMLQTNRVVFPFMLNHAFLTFTQILKKPQRLSTVVGCTLLLWIKTSSTAIGVLRGLMR
jgi:glycosyltransferase involved in cell wall biosynthesis